MGFEHISSKQMKPLDKGIAVLLNSFCREQWHWEAEAEVRGGL